MSPRADLISACGRERNTAKADAGDLLRLFGWAGFFLPTRIPEAPRPRLGSRRGRMSREIIVLKSHFECSDGIVAAR
jgi:hypothetical protein